MGEVRSNEQLRQIYDPPLPLVVRKTLDHLDQHCVRFIARSPFFCLASCDAEGRCDVSPRGDPPGFVQVADANTLYIPDRKGNNRLDSLGNLLANPGVGLVFLIPGIDETLRVNGRAEIAEDPELLASLAVFGAPPRSALRVTVEEAFIHCGRALKRSRLWDPDGHADRGEVPTVGEWLRDQVDPDERERALLERGAAAERRAAERPEELY
jgi:PPOX class probable FMN-dependent enzyme